jgi:hypothetical protein
LPLEMDSGLYVLAIIIRFSILPRNI